LLAAAIAKLDGKCGQPGWGESTCCECSSAARSLILILTCPSGSLDFFPRGNGKPPDPSLAAIDRLETDFAYVFQATCLFAITAYFFMAPNYEKAWWLKANEKAALRAAYNATGRGAEADAHFSWAEVILAFKVRTRPSTCFSGLLSATYEFSSEPS